LISALSSATDGGLEACLGMTLSVTDDGADAAARVWGSSTSSAFEAQGFFVLMTALNLRLFFGRTTRFCFFGSGADLAGYVEA
jgi:hypothetical protein